MSLEGRGFPDTSRRSGFHMSRNSSKSQKTFATESIFVANVPCQPLESSSLDRICCAASTIAR